MAFPCPPNAKPGSFLRSAPSSTNSHLSKEIGQRRRLRWAELNRFAPQFNSAYTSCNGNQRTIIINKDASSIMTLNVYHRRYVAAESFRGREHSLLSFTFASRLQTAHGSRLCLVALSFSYSTVTNRIVHTRPRAHWIRASTCLRTIHPVRTSRDSFRPKSSGCA